MGAIKFGGKVEGVNLAYLSNRVIYQNGGFL
jgi:hypothetical protein